jgi:uncharacterized protein YbjT (DUF2867 family)
VIAVTGARGFVASHLIPRLVERGEHVVAVVRPESDASALERRGCEIRRAHLARPETLGGVFAGARGVVHLAGIAQAVTLVPALEAANVTRAVFVGSAGVYTKLVSAGAEAKREGEAALRASRLSYTILRPSMIYGTRNDRNLVRLLRWIDRFPLIPVPAGGRTLQQPVHVDDLCQAILAALDREVASRREYDVGGPEAIRLSALIREAAHALSRPVWLIPVPLSPAHALATIARRLRLPFPISPEQVLRLMESKAVDIGPARRDLGFSPRTFAAGVAAQVAELRAAV